MFFPSRVLPCRSGRSVYANPLFCRSVLESLLEPREGCDGTSVGTSDALPEEEEAEDNREGGTRPTRSSRDGEGRCRVTVSTSLFDVLTPRRVG